MVITGVFYFMLFWTISTERPSKSAVVIVLLFNLFSQSLLMAFSEIPFSSIALTEA